MRILPIAAATVMVAAGLVVVVSPAQAAFAGTNGLIAYDQFRGDTAGSQIWTVDPATREQTDISGSNFGDDKPRFSPSGTIIVFRHDNQIWSMTAAGGSRTNLPREGRDRSTSPPTPPTGPRSSTRSTAPCTS